MKHPKLFHKYTSAESTAKILKSGTLKWSSPHEFNDILEFNRMPTMNPTVEDDFEKYISLLLEHVFENKKIDTRNLSNETLLLVRNFKLMKEGNLSKEFIFKEMSHDKPDQSIMEKLLTDHVKSWGNDCARILCVTTEENNNAMWANYADNHKGCVLTFQHLPEKDTPLMAAKQVKYSKSKPVVCSGIDFLLYGNKLQGILENTHEAICYTKDKSWEYEKEWRAITWRHREKGKKFSFYKFFSEELHSITFGFRIDNEKRTEIIKILDLYYPHCKKYKIEINEGKMVKSPLT